LAISGATVIIVVADPSRIPSVGLFALFAVK
jgi:hypothetical protein